MKAVARWAWRMFRREWRQQFLVLALLTVAVAGAIGGAAVAYDLAPQRDAALGTADQALVYRGGRAAAHIAVARAFFGTVDVVTHRTAPVAGSVETVDLRAQDPHGPYGAATVRLLHGRYPVRAGEVAVTVGVAGLVGADLTVVGQVENPRDLSDEFGLLAPSDPAPPESVTILVRASKAKLEAFRATAQGPGEVAERGWSAQTARAAGVLAVATVVLLLVSLVAAAGFAVVAQRRQRQFGMLAAVGATDRHLRTVTLVNGAVVGTAAALAGTTLGVLVSILVAPYLETAAGHRIDRLGVPWWLIATADSLAVVMATAAAWWPARAAARVPVMVALSARTPRPIPARRSARAGGLLLAGGAGLLALSRQTNPLLIVAGTLGVAGGMLLLCPSAIRMLGFRAARLPVAVRLALRDLARFQARSAAALAAISLALAIPASLVLVTGAAAPAADAGNLSDHQLLIHVGSVPGLLPSLGAASLAALDARIGAAFQGARVVPVEMVVDPAMGAEKGPGGREGGRPLVDLGRRVGAHAFRAIPLYVATPAMLAYVGVTPAVVAAGTDVLTEETGELGFSGADREVPVAQRVPLPGYSSGPRALIPPAAVRRHGWTALRGGWLVEAPHPLTSGEIAAARDLAAQHGLRAEARRDRGSLAALRYGTTAAGGLLAIGVLAIALGLVRGESAGDLQTLTATGATATVRRTLAATTAGALALLGVVLGTAGALVAVGGAYLLTDFGALGRVPVLLLVIPVVALPPLAAACGWLFAGREPPAIARRALT